MKRIINLLFEMIFRNQRSNNAAKIAELMKPIEYAKINPPKEFAQSMRTLLQYSGK